MNVLGTVPAAWTQVWHETRWFRTRSETQTVRYLDWTIDGRPLRDYFPDDAGEAGPETTSLVASPVQGTTNLGMSNLHHLLGTRATAAGWDTFDDGRIALLFCPTCADLDCATLSCELVITPSTVEWRDVGWQVGYLPFLDPEATATQTPKAFTFERQPYESLLSRILDAGRQQPEGWTTSP